MRPIHEVCYVAYSRLHRLQNQLTHITAFVG